MPAGTQLVNLKESTVLVPHTEFDWCSRYSFTVPKFEIFTNEAENDALEAEDCTRVWFQDAIDEFKVLID